MIFKFVIILIFLNIALPSDIDRGYSDSLKAKNPAIAWKLSIVPGLGQIYNESYAKSAFFIISESYFLLEIEKHSHLIKTRNKFAWWFLAVYFMNIVDAYVEAELSTFPENNKEGTR